MFRYGRWFVSFLALHTLPATAVTLEQVNRTTIVAPMDINGGVRDPWHVSRDGRYALFDSSANNLVAGDTNGMTDLFLYDAQIDTIERVNLGNDGTQMDFLSFRTTAVTGDGRWVFFNSATVGVVPSAEHIYLRDRAGGTTTLLIRDGNGQPLAEPTYFSDVSEDGRYVLFATSAQMLSADHNDEFDVYRLDRVSGDYQLVSVALDGSAAGRTSHSGQLSADGRYAVFGSWAGNIVAGDQNENFDLFWRDLDQGQTLQVGRSEPYGSPTDVSVPLLPRGNAVSDDGRYVLLETGLPLLPADTNGTFDGYRFDSSDGSLQRVTLGIDAAQIEYYKTVSGLSADGMSVLFIATTPVLPGDPVGSIRAYWRNIASGEITPVLLRAGASGSEGRVLGCTPSADANVAYCTSSTQPLFLGPEDGYANLFRTVRGESTVRRVSRPLAQATAHANGHSGVYSVAASSDGRYVAFDSSANNLVIGDNNGVGDVFVRDRLFGTTARVSVSSAGAERSCPSTTADISADGRYVVFESCGTGGAAEAPFQIYRFDRLTGQLLVVSTDYKGSPGDRASRQPQISDDGDVVLFRSIAQNLGVPANPNGDYFLRDMAVGTTTIVSRNPITGQSDGTPYGAWLAGNGRFVAFSDVASNLVEKDTNARADVFVFDRHLRQLDRASQAADGAQLNDGSYCHGISADGSQVLFTTDAILPEPASNYRNLVVRDRYSGAFELANRDSHGAAVDGFGAPALSADGRRVVFADWSDSWYRSYYELFVFDRDVQRTYHLGRVADEGAIEQSQFSPDGDWLVFSSASAYLPAGQVDGNGRFSDVIMASGLRDPIFADGFQVPIH